MAPLIRALLVVLIVKLQTELQVESATNQKTISSDLKVDMLKTVLTNYLTMVNVELRKTNDHVRELEFSVNDNQETVSTDLDDTKRQMGVMERKVDDLQESVSALTKLLNGRFQYFSSIKKPSTSASEDTYIKSYLGNEHWRVFIQLCEKWLPLKGSIFIKYHTSSPF